MKRPSPNSEPLAGAKLSFEGLPEGFRWQQNGIYHQSDDAEARESRLCSPLQVTDTFEDASGGNQGHIIAFKDGRGRRQAVSLSDRDLATEMKAVRRKLADRGFWLRQGRAADEAFLQLIRNWKVPVTLTAAYMLGWTDRSCRSFLLRNGQYLGEPGFHFTGRLSPGAATEPVSAGTVEIWRDSVAALCVDNALLTAAVSLAFAGPLLDLLDEPGFCLHLKDATSSFGLTLQRVATSVWGHPDLGQTWRAASADIGAAATGTNGMLLTLDRIEEISDRDLRRTLQTLTDGLAKRQAKGAPVNLSLRRWRGAILSSGNASIAKIASPARLRPNGLDVEIIEVASGSESCGLFDDLHGSADAAAFSARIDTASRQSYGTGGEAFVARLISRKADFQPVARRMLASIVACMVSENALTRDVTALRVARQLSLIALAGEFATTCGITGWKKGEALKAARLLLKTWLADRDIRRGAAIGEAVARLRRFLQSEGNSFAERGAESATAGPGWKDAHYFYLTFTAWKGLHGREARKAARDLAEAGILVPEDDVNLSRHAPNWIPGRPRVYWMRADLLEPLAADRADATVRADFPPRHGGAVGPGDRGPQVRPDR